MRARFAPERATLAELLPGEWFWGAGRQSVAVCTPNAIRAWVPFTGPDAWTLVDGNEATITIEPGICLAMARWNEWHGRLECGWWRQAPHV